MKKTIIILATLMIMLLMGCEGNKQPSLSQVSVVLEEGQSTTVQVFDCNDTVSWVSSFPEIALVENGEITAIKEGYTKIIATIGDTVLSCDVLVIFNLNNYQTSLIAELNSYVNSLNHSDYSESHWNLIQSIKEETVILIQVSEIREEIYLLLINAKVEISEILTIDHATYLLKEEKIKELSDYVASIDTSSLSAFNVILIQSKLLEAIQEITKSKETSFDQIVDKYIEIIDDIVEEILELSDLISEILVIVQDWASNLSEVDFSLDDWHEIQVLVNQTMDKIANLSDEEEIYLALSDYEEQLNSFETLDQKLSNRKTDYLSKINLLISSINKSDYLYSDWNILENAITTITVNIQNCQFIDILDRIYSEFMSLVSSIKPLTKDILILQVYGTGGSGNNNTTSVSHSFIELYNKSSSDIDLSGYSIQYARLGDDWKMLELNGTIKANSSYLILGRQASTVGTSLTLKESDADILWDIRLDNKEIKVVLLATISPLTVCNPFNVDGQGTKANGYIDMVGAYGDDIQLDGYEKSPIGGLSKQKSVRRISSTDNDNNRYDFEIIDYRVENLPSDMFEIVRPKNSKHGKWDPFQLF